MRPHPFVRYCSGDGWVEAWHRDRLIASAEQLRGGDWLLRRSVNTGEGTNSIHLDESAARDELVRWARMRAWQVDRYPYGSTTSKDLRKRP